MAGDVAPEGTAPAAPVEESGETLVQPPPRREESLPYPMRFRLAYFALAMVLGAAVGGFVLFLGWPDSKEEPFSAWQPTKDGESRAWEIADHVSSRYRHPSGSRLVVVRPSPPVVQMPTVDGQREQVPIRAIFVRGRTTDLSDAEAKSVSENDTLIFSLCGGGEACAMDEGSPTRERGALLRREALELALYAYKYVDHVDTIVTLLPPVRTTTAQGQPANLQRLIYFRHSDLSHVLNVPLEKLLPGRPSLTMPPGISQTVDQLVVPRQFQYSVQPGQQGEALLILAPVTG
jgi:hypothetical protein